MSSTEQPSTEQPAMEAEEEVVQRTDRRLMITKMSMENFKSYYGVQEVGPFHKCFSSVVGPNGSGKSNVIDAMLFVFGKRAKQIRQAKTGDLIHRSENHDNLDYCRVSVFFQDIIDKEDGEFEVVPGSQIVVTREGRRDNSSSYYLDGKKATWKEVGSLLRKRGIDLDHNRFLILQGEVEQIAMMKPKGATEHETGMLEYIEDIVGSDRFKEEIEAEGKKQEELTEQWGEKLNRVKAVEKEKDALEGGKLEAEEFLLQENELTARRSQLFQCYQLEAARAAATGQDKLQACRDKLEGMRKALQDSVGDVKAMEQEYKKEMAEFTKLQEAVESAKANFTAFERRDVQHREDLKHAKAKEKKLVKSIAADTSAASAEKDHMGTLTTRTKGYEKDIAAFKAQAETEEEKLDAIYSSLKGETSELQKELEAKEKKLEPLSKTLNEAQAAADLCRAQLDIACSTAKQLQAHKDEAAANLEKAKSTYKEREQEAKTLKKRKAQFTNELHEAEQALQAIQQSEQPLADKVRSERSRFEEAKQTSQQASSGNKVLEELMKASKSGKLGGVYGRLGDLGAIDKEYDVAISTACGALNNVVVQTVQQAQACVEYIRKNNIGRATFVILDQIEHLRARMHHSASFPENVSRLFDLVRVKDDKFLPAFYFALRDTLVAKDLDQATRIAYKGGKAQHRVVTLEGALIDTSGTMAGGGTRVAKGGMASSIADTLSLKELQQLEKQLDQDVKLLNEQRQQKVALEMKITELQKALAQIDVDLERCSMDVEALQAQQEELARQLAELNKKEGSSKEDLRKQKELETQLAKDEKVLAKAQQAAASVEAEVKAVQQAILDVGGVRLKSQKSKVDGINEQISTLQANLAKANVELKTAQRNCDKLEAKIKKDTAELEKNKEHMNSIEAEFKAVEEGAREVMEQFKVAQQLLQEKDESMRDMKGRHEKIKAEVAKFREVEVDMEHQMEELERSTKDSQTKEKQWARKISGLKLHKIGVEDDEDEKSEAAASKPDDKMQEDGQSEEQAAVSKPVAVLRVLTEEEINAVDREAIEYEIRVLEEKLSKLKPNMTAIKEYYKKEKEYLMRVAELDAITEKRDAVRGRYEALRKQRLETFMAGFGVITTKLKEMYQMITLGGDAELELVDRLNPFSEGIQFSVRPPKKSWKNISNLSGGEKTLSSLALVFALHHYKPTPLYVMDEIDAALDFKNVSIVANYIKERTKNAQFIIISLRNNMFELADRLIGIYKTENCTKSVTINPALVAAQQAESRAPLAATNASDKRAAPQAAMVA
eukprot:m.147220 g.147220  ORF g.147220 m.147220 type:complete len:1291 (-) comp20562_c0_seq1:30-3902(-)